MLCLGMAEQLPRFTFYVFTFHVAYACTSPLTTSTASVAFSA